MLRRGPSFLAVIACLMVACGPGDGPPAVTIDRTACGHCGMLVSDLRTAGALRVPGQEAMVFDDIGCLISAMQELPGVGVARVWVHDAEGQGWIDAYEAVLTRAAPASTPMGSGLLARPAGATLAADAAALDFERLLTERDNESQGDR